MKKELILELLKMALESKGENKEAPTETNLPFRVGGKYFIRTVTYHLTGKVKEIIGNFLVLEDAAWIADSGRFSQAIKKGILDEIEPVDEWIVNVNSITDAGEWKHSLPRKEK